MAWRFRFDRLAPAHGWRGFLTELVIVVLGVLIALGAQQAVDSWRTASDVADFRAALRTELGENLGAYRGRVVQSRCLGARLDQLEAWQRDWRDGDGPALSGTIGRPLAYSLRASVWRAGANGVAAHMPLDERLAYASIYDGLENYDRLRLSEFATWQALFAFDNAARLSPPEVNALRGLILVARSTDRSIQRNWAGLVADATALGVRATINRTMQGQGNGLCAPLRPSR